MNKTSRMYETKAQRARRLPVGTWFVYPDVMPIQFRYYQPKVYRVVEGKSGHNAIRSAFEDIGIWEGESGPNTPQAAYDRAIALCAYLNSVQADMMTADKYIKEQRRQSARRGAASLGDLLGDARR